MEMANGCGGLATGSAEKSGPAIRQGFPLGQLCRLSAADPGVTTRRYHKSGAGRPAGTAPQKAPISAVVATEETINQPAEDAPDDPVQPRTTHN